MAMKVSDRWLWLSLGVFTFFAVRSISHKLTTLHHLITTHAAPLSEPRKVSQETEDAISLSSLETLATGSSTDLRTAATKILVTRFLHNKAARASLCADLQSADKADPAYKSAIKALQLIATHAGLHPLKNFPAVPGNPYFDYLDFAQRWELHTADGVPGGRRREESFEEQALRRRRREAMVLNEGDRPVSRGDIFQRGPGGTRDGAADRETENLEREFARLVSRELAAASAGTE